jgi:hypothetical protein
MSKKLVEVRLNQKTGEITLGQGSLFNMGTVMYRDDYAYLTVSNKESDIKKAKKSLTSAEVKRLNKIIKDAEKKKSFLKKEETATAIAKKNKVKLK